MSVELEHEQSIAVIRESFAFFGYPLDDMTDEEIEAGVVRIGEAIGNTGISADEAMQNLAVMAAVARAR